MCFGGKLGASNLARPLTKYCFLHPYRTPERYLALPAPVYSLRAPSLGSALRFHITPLRSISSTRASTYIEPPPFRCQLLVVRYQPHPLNSRPCLSTLSSCCIFAGHSVALLLRLHWLVVLLAQVPHPLRLIPISHNSRCSTYSVDFVL